MQISVTRAVMVVDWIGWHYSASRTKYIYTQRFKFGFACITRPKKVLQVSPILNEACESVTGINLAGYKY